MEPQSPPSGVGGAGTDGAADLSETEFTERFGDLVGRRDFAAAASLCRQRLKAKPEDRYARELQQTIQAFMDAVEEAQVGDAEDEDGELPPQLDEIDQQAAEAVSRGFEAMFAYLREDEERLWRLGEQAVGIFWDVGAIASPGPLGERLREMSLALTATLSARLKAAGRPAPDGSATGASDAGDDGEGGKTMSRSDWLLEALGQLWWQVELDMTPETWLLEGCREELAASGGSMEVLVGYSNERLPEAEYSELCDILTQTWNLERSLVCGLFGEGPPPATLEYGTERVLQEILRRPLIEAPLPGFYDCFYLMTHIVYVLNCFNGALPNARGDCPWLYAYLERCLKFWLREVHRDKAANLTPAVAARMYSADAVDAIAEAADCLRGLGEPLEDSTMGEAVREGFAFLLAQQEADGMFFSPGALRDPSDEYNHVHPTWTAVAALQLSRRTPGPSPRCAAWARHARSAAAQAGLALLPPHAASEAPAAAPSRASPSVASGSSSGAPASSVRPASGATPPPARSAPTASSAARSTGGFGAGAAPTSAVAAGRGAPSAARPPAADGAGRRTASRGRGGGVSTGQGPYPTGK